MSKRIKEGPAFTLDERVLEVTPTSGTYIFHLHPIEGFAVIGVPTDLIASYNNGSITFRERVVAHFDETGMLQSLYDSEPIKNNAERHRGEISARVLALPHLPDLKILPYLRAKQ